MPCSKHQNESLYVTEANNGCLRCRSTSQTHIEPCQEKTEIEKLKDAITRALKASIPYITQYGAFLIPAENWSELSGLVSPAAARLNAILSKIEKGEKPTEAEIEEALGD